jgi:hypothetical protein
MDDTFEKLGAFYLGRTVDPATGARAEAPFLYDSRDLTTHGVIVGMTGSGKTGLALGVLEEAAMDRIPVIAIDPKGDLGNALLTFPDLAASDFRPWINEDTARQRGEDPEAFAAGQAELWRNGLASWGQDGSRIRRLREHADFAVYTPGSAAGRQVSVLRSFAPPGAELADDPDALRDRLQTTVTSLLALLGIQADPVRSREHNLLSAILSDAWAHGRTLELGQLIEAIQRPPITRVGVMELESFYPAKDRFELALRLNGVLASPSFAAWMEGEPLDIDGLLYTTEGRPRVSIFSIAHLGDDERMFFVSMLLNEILSWMRGQSGTSSLRALVYMDEIFGFFPPTANPPSKPPMLTLLKQARAYGVGILLATQNPVDLDYKGLGNTGSWFIGRLQTERDKSRILDALQGAAAGEQAPSRQDLDRLVSGLGNRVFLLHNVHDSAPTLFETRWVMSYLAGPMTLSQIRRLKGDADQAPRGEGERAPVPASTGLSSAPPGIADAPASMPSAPTVIRPVLPAGIREFYLAPFRSGSELRYRPALLVAANVAYRNARAGIDESRSVQVVLPFAAGPIAVDWARAETLELDLEHLDAEPIAGIAFAELPPEASQPRSYDRWGREAARWIQAEMPLTLLESATPKAISRPDESEAAFRLRLADLCRENRDARLDAVRQRYEPRLRTLQERERRALQQADRRAGMAQQRAIDAALNVGQGLLGAFLGRKTPPSRVTGSIRAAGRAMETRSEVARAAETVESVRAEIARMDEEFQEELRRIEADTAADGPLSEVQVRPTLTGITVRLSALAWLPEDAAADAGMALWR